METEKSEISAQENTKRCSHCGNILPLDNFHRNKSMPDGYSITCKACVSEMYKTRRIKRTGAHTKTIVSRTVVGGGNPKLAEFKPRELIEELRFRGYKGALTFTQEVKL